MLSSFIIAAIGIVGVMLAWVGVQTLWKDIFPEDVIDDDPLAGRKSCGDCGCSAICRIDQEKMQHENSFIMNNK